MTRASRGSVTAKVLALCDGSLTSAQIADRTGVRVEYVRTVLQRNPEAQVRFTRARSGATVNRLPSLPPSIDDANGLRVPPIAGPTYRAIRDRAEAVGVSYDEICRKLLSVAVEVGDLDTHFPIGGAA